MASLYIACLVLSHVVTSSATTSFLVMGDWGGKERSPYYTSDEKDTATGMNLVAADLRATFALALGDNIYNTGVRSVHDKRFDETFESVFTGGALSDKSGFKFHPIAGNHDHIGNVSAQVEYSNVSSRWVFPSLYYTFTETFEDGATVQFVMIDTVILSGNSQISNANGIPTQLPGTNLPGPADKVLADQQLQWIEQTLSASKADYLIVGGHYPIYSICEHGPTEQLQQYLKPLLLKYKASSYLAGHDHCAEHIDVGDGIQYHVIGSAAYHFKFQSHIHTLKHGQLKYHNGNAGGGFASIVVSKNQMLVTHHNENGHHLYNSTISPRDMFIVSV